MTPRPTTHTAISSDSSSRGDPRLVRYLTMVTAWMLPEWSTGPSGDSHEVAEGIAEAGFHGVQVFLPEQAGAIRDAGLDLYAIGRVDAPSDIGPFVDAWEQQGVTSVTLHLGTGYETAEAGERLIDSYLEVEAATSIEVLVETHRATIMQDPARALGIIAEHPQIRLTADLAHWYTGGEMPYGGFEWKLEAIQPALDRVRLVHGRISDPGCAQVAVSADDESRHVEHFRQMWGATFRGFLAAPDRPSRLPFAPELLPPVTNYARTVIGSDGERREETDRWQQALLLCELAEKLFAEALADRGRTSQ